MVYYNVLAQTLLGIALVAVIYNKFIGNDSAYLDYQTCYHGVLLACAVLGMIPCFTLFGKLAILPGTILLILALKHADDFGACLFTYFTGVVLSPEPSARTFFSRMLLNSQAVIPARYPYDMSFGSYLNVSVKKYRSFLAMAAACGVARMENNNFVVQDADSFLRLAHQFLGDASE